MKNHQRADWDQTTDDPGAFRFAVPARRSHQVLACDVVIDYVLSHLELLLDHHVVVDDRLIGYARQ